MWDFIKGNKFKILLCIIALLFGMLIYSASTDGVSNIPKNLMNIIATPFQQVSSAISNGVGGFFDQFTNAAKKQEENDALKSEIADLNNKLINYEKLKQENAQLREITGIKEINPGLELMAASVVSRDATDPYSTFMIDKGSLTGVAVGDPVMTKEGLVGVVLEVSATSSTVRTLLSPDINVSSLAINSKDLGIVTGDIGFSPEGNTKMSILADKLNIKQGEIITTAGVSGMFPANIPIGTVDTIGTESHGMSKYAKIIPFTDIKNVESVFVVTSFNGQVSKVEDKVK